MLIDPELIMPNPNLSIMDGGLTASGWNNVRGDSISRMYFDALAKRYHFKLTDPIKELPKEAIDAILYGTKGEALQLRYEKNEGFGVISASSRASSITLSAATGRHRVPRCARISRSACPR